MRWVWLFAAIALEVASTTGLAVTAVRGQVPLWGTVASLAGVVVSYLLVDLAMHLGVPLSIAYGMWSGVGTAALAFIGIRWLGESSHPVKLFGIAFIVVGVLMVNLAPTGRLSALRVVPLTAEQVRQELVLANLDHALAELLGATRSFARHGGERAGRAA